MSIQEASLRTTYGSIVFGLDFRFVAGTVVTPVGAQDIIDHSLTQETVTTTHIREIHPFVAMIGSLANHPLRDDWLRDMGLSPDADLDVL